MPQSGAARKRSAGTTSSASRRRPRDVVRSFHFPRTQIDQSQDDLLVAAVVQEVRFVTGLFILQADLSSSGSRNRLQRLRVAGVDLLVSDQCVAVADVDRGGATDPLQGRVQGPGPPTAGLVGPEVEIGLIQLDDVGALLVQSPQFPVDDGSEVHSQRLLIGVVLVDQAGGGRQGSDHGHLHGT